MRRVMVFGVFDGLHDGHLHFFREARRHGDELIVVVTPDSVVELLKGKKPKENAEERVKSLLRSGEVHNVVLGDETLGSWNILHVHKPHVIALGYDQDNIKKELESLVFEWSPELLVMEAHKPEELHSSLLKK